MTAGTLDTDKGTYWASLERVVNLMDSVSHQVGFQRQPCVLEILALVVQLQGGWKFLVHCGRTIPNFFGKHLARGDFLVDLKIHQASHSYYVVQSQMRGSALSVGAVGV